MDQSSAQKNTGKIPGKVKTAISPTRAENYPEWYQQVVDKAELAEGSAVHGCMVIKPWGYALWENIQRVMDAKFKETGHQNAYFPLFIPLSYLQKEATHVEGFAMECAVVTHHKLEKDGSGKLQPAGKLEEPLIVRPTSEMIIGESFSKWIQSWRDLPLLINQWANVVRWEMRTRLFLRTTEILWQEGHTAHATEDEAVAETEQMLKVYADFGRDYLAIPFIRGIKSENERFPGAVETYTIEAMMQDRKALQAGTSHYLGQNFAKASNIKFLDKDGVHKYVYTTSWGSTTRLIGAIAMTHGDDDGMVMPPRVAPTHLVIIPIAPTEEAKKVVLNFCEELQARMRKYAYYGREISVLIDKRDLTNGEKRWSWVKKGVPLIVEIGPRDLESKELQIQRRNGGEKLKIKAELLPEKLPELLDELHNNLLAKALAFRMEHTVKVDSEKAFREFFTPKNAEKPEVHGGFAFCHWNGNLELAAKLKEELKVTIRCIPLKGEVEGAGESGTCIFSGEPSKQRVIFAKAY